MARSAFMLSTAGRRYITLALMTLFNLSLRHNSFCRLAMGFAENLSFPRKLKFNLVRDEHVEDVPEEVPI